MWIQLIWMNHRDMFIPWSLSRNMYCEKCVLFLVVMSIFRNKCAQLIRWVKSTKLWYKVTALRKWNEKKKWNLKLTEEYYRKTKSVLYRIYIGNIFEMPSFCMAWQVKTSFKWVRFFISVTRKHCCDTVSVAVHSKR